LLLLLLLLLLPAGVGGVRLLSWMDPHDCHGIAIQHYI
jgi:hypothetical protein